jgi:type II secretory pathway predicted ATPase ExeA
MISLAHAFGFSSEPFAQEVPLDKLFPLPGLEPLLQRFDYALHTDLVTVITGEVGSGKSTSLRYAQSRLHPSQYRILSLIATTCEWYIEFPGVGKTEFPGTRKAEFPVVGEKKVL